MNDIKVISELDVKGKRVLIRADLNVPINEQLEVTDANRIKQFLPTLNYVLDNGGLPIVISHLGRPAGKAVPELSLKPVADKIKELTGKPVALASDCVGPEVAERAAVLQEGKILLLENLRFHSAEKDNSVEFAKELAHLADIYVNDAFGTAHRRHASMVSIPQFMKEKAVGLLMNKELEYFKKALQEPVRPLCVVLGGAKVSSKLNALMNIADKADKIIIGGAMANTFLAAQGFQMARSLVERELFPKVIELIAILARRNCQLYLPVDFVVGPSPKAQGLGRAVPAQEIPADSMALDIGPATSLLYKEALQTAETIIWNGPMGAFENEEFANGTTDLIEHLSSAHGMTVVGGGDTDAAIHQMELGHKFDYISTGGGAFLALLEGKTLPALAALQ